MRPCRRLAAAPETVAAGLTYVAAALAGGVAGLSVAAAGLALAGQSICETPPERARLFLVLGPLVALLPLSALAFGAARYRDVARCAPAALGLWLAAAIVTAYWFGIRPLLR